jgi:RNA-directed DNA polymerase
MDDFIVLAKTRWHLRKALRTINQHFNQLKVLQAPNKTFNERIKKDLIFWVIDLAKKCTFSKRTLENHSHRLT